MPAMISRFDKILNLFDEIAQELDHALLPDMAEAARLTRDVFKEDAIARFHVVNRLRTETHPDFLQKG